MIQFEREYHILPHEALLRRMVRILFNAGGRETERAVYDGNARLIRKIITRYDEADRLQSKESFGRTLRLAARTTYHYDSGNRLQAIHYTDASGRVMARRLWFFNAHGCKTEYRKEDKKGRISQRIRYSYDAQNVLTRERHYGANEQLLYDKLFYYDAHRRERELEIRTPDKRLKVRRRSKYNQAGRILRYDWYDEKEHLQRREIFSYFPDSTLQTEKTEDLFAGQFFMRQYDEKGRLLRQRHSVNNRLLEELIFRYDDTKGLSWRFKYAFPDGRQKLADVQTTNLMEKKPLPLS